MLDQFTRILYQIAEARRIHGTNERDGTIHQVWRQNGEQKVRVNIGQRPDGSPWLTPWIKLEDHHGSARQQRKYHKGQNVKVSTVGADFSKATVTPHGENTNHPEPKNATDNHESYQFGQRFERSGPDFSERWMADSHALSGSTADPDQVAKVLQRWGAKPQQQQDQNSPWDGPDPNQGSPQKRILSWVGDPGEVPKQNGDAITWQFDKDAKTELTNHNVLRKVQSPDGPPMQSPDAGDGGAQQVSIDHLGNGTLLHQIKTAFGQIITTALHQNGDITHTIQDAQGNTSRITQQANQVIHQLQGANGFSMIIQSAEQIMHQVGNSILQITQGGINIQTPNLNLNGANNVTGFSSPPPEPSVDPTTGTGNPILAIDISAALTVEAKIQA